MAQFELTVETDPQEGVVRLRLTDGAGRHLGGGAVRLADHSTWFWEGLFDAQEHVDRYAGAVRRGGAERPATAEELLAELGVFLGEKVLGPAAMAALWKGMAHRTLVVRLPKTEDDPLAAAFARVPWEVARPAPGAEPLLARNLVVRAVAAEVEEGGEAPGPGPGEPLRVLLVFAEAPGSRPLAMRLERQRLLELFHDEVLSERQVEVEVLCHGVTRERLKAAVREGCHVLHWSGHGHQDLLELQGEDGRADVLTGAELVDLLQAAGGFIPRLVFLSACLSGALVEARSFEELGAALAGARPGRRAAEVEAAALDQLLGARRGYTSTALALLAAGVPQVVAMRYEVGDAYARDLARGFYKDLLAGKARPVDSALTLARGDLLRKKGDWYSAVDHATPLVLGREGLVVSAPAGRSVALERWRPRPQPLLPHPNRELEPAPGFVGRGRELTRLGRDWLPRGGPAVALLQGLAGLGKTALAAEAVDLWHREFDWVFAFQAKPGELKLEDFLRRLDERWTLASGAYRQRCEGSPFSRVFLPVGELTGARRYEVLRNNLVEAMSGERVLLVLDNFETNLETVPGEGGLRCLDPEWDRLLGELAERLPGTGSRVLVTSRHRLACLAGDGRAALVALAALPMGEAALYLQSHPDLAALARAGAEGWALAERLLRVSRGHPLILTRLGHLARDRQALAAALERLESEGLSALAELPDPFAGKRSVEEWEKERLYIEDVAVRSMDLLLGRVSEPARRLLWVASLGFEPVEEPVIQGVWEQGSEEPPAGPLLAELLAAGLLGGEGEEGGRSLSCHELVRERAAAWMAAHPGEWAGRTAEQVWTAYGEIYEALFQALRRSGQPGSRDLAAQVGRRGVSSLLRARAFDRLGSFASGLVIGTRDRALLGTVIAELEAAAGQVPPGEPRWSLRTNLADALDSSGQPERALPFYEQAATEAEEAEHWRDVGWICQNWAVALMRVGRLDEARATYLRSAEAKRQAGSPRVPVFGSELEALRLDVKRGEAGRALPEIESRLVELRGWWRRARAGEEVPEAPDPVFLGRALVSGLDVAHQANLALERWQPCLELLAEIEETQSALGEGEHERAGIRFNRYGPLLRLGRLDEAQGVLKGCLAVFRRAEDADMEAATLTALADLWDERADPARAADLERQALAVENLLPDPEGRSISHGNLSNYLDRSGQPEDAARHLLAAIAYALVTGQRQNLAVFFSNLSIRIHRAAAAGGRYELPRLADLLALPDFTPLRQFLAECGADPADLQAAIDQLVEQARAAAAGGAAGQGQDVPGPSV